MQTTIPFGGFYYSHHDSSIAQALDLMFSDDGGEINPLVYEAQSDIDWRAVHTEYTKAYARELSEALGVRFTFSELYSPREYNFTTDRIFCDIEFSEFSRMLSIKNETMDSICAAMFTSRDGFMSYYSPEWRTWGIPENWDINQCGAVLAAYIAENLDDDFELYAMDDYSGNGYIDEWLRAAMGPKALRALKVSDYLRSRENRAYA